MDRISVEGDSSLNICSALILALSSPKLPSRKTTRSGLCLASSLTNVFGYIRIKAGGECVSVYKEDGLSG